MASSHGAGGTSAARAPCSIRPGNGDPAAVAVDQQRGFAGSAIRWASQVSRSGTSRIGRTRILFPFIRTELRGFSAAR
jgi:hypothetical protein